MLLPFGALAQTDWPTKPISMVVPYPPGGVNDAVARVYAEKLSAELGKPVHRRQSRRRRHDRGLQLRRPRRA